MREIDIDTAPGHLIRLAQQRHQALWGQLVGTDLTSVQFAILTLVKVTPEPDQRTLAERASVDTSTLADVCRRLERRGLLERGRDPSDSRRLVLWVTPAGAELLDRLSPAVAEVGHALLQGLDDAQASTLITLLAKLL